MSWNANNWAQLYNDQLIATSTMEQPYDAFTGRAVIYESISATQPFPVDLIVESLDFAFNEHTQTEIHVGNGFSFIAFGKNAMELRANGVLHLWIQARTSERTLLWISTATTFVWRLSPDVG